MAASTKKTRLFAILAVVLFALALLGFGLLAGNPLKASAEEQARVNLAGLDASLENLVATDPELASSSNPYDYIKDGRNEYYNAIVALGPEALPELERTLNDSAYEGLTEYLVAVAIEEVSGADVKAITEDPYAWSDARGFSGKWAEIKEALPGSIYAILDSKDLSDEEKMDRVEDYGLLAVPAVEDALSPGSFDQGLIDALDEYVAGHPLSHAEKAALG